MVSTIEYIIGIIIVAILLFAIIIKYRNNEKEWILTAIFIGLVSLPIGLIIIGKIIYIQILDILISSIILSIFYSVIRKNPNIFLKTFLVAVLVSVIVFVGWFNASMGEGGLFVEIQKYDSIEEMSNHTHSEFKILLKEEDLNKYPGIKKAIDECVNSNKCTSKVDSSEWEIRTRVNQYVNINGKYYLLDFYWSD
jgi:hypothetical protein